MNARNPWGLTAREAEAMDAMLARGTLKRVAILLGIEVNTVQVHLARSREKMQPPHKLGHFLMWDRWRRLTQEIPKADSPSEILLALREQAEHGGSTCYTPREVAEHVERLEGFVAGVLRTAKIPVTAEN